MKLKNRIQAYVYAASFLAGSFVQAFDLTYPHSEKTSQVDEYFSMSISDPYRWLEDADSPETLAWIDKQNTFTQSYLSQISLKDKIKARLTELLNYEKYSAPFKAGDYLFFSKNNGLQNQSIIYMQRGSGEAEVFLDPNTFSEDGTTAINSIVPSHDHKYAAISISEAGSDWKTIRVMEISKIGRAHV